MKYTVEFKTPAGKFQVEVPDANSHLEASEEASGDPGVLEKLMESGREKFTAKVRRSSDNAVRLVLVRVEVAPPAAAAPAKPASKNCFECGEERPPSGYEFSIEEGSAVCHECGNPTKEKDAAKLAGFDASEETLAEQEAEIPDAPTQEEAEIEFKRGFDRDDVLSVLRPEQVECLRENGLLPKVCDNCGELATEQDTCGVDLCDDCYLEMLCEDDEDAPVEIPEDKRFYLVVFGDHLAPGDPDRLSLRVKSPNPRAALTAAEYAAKEQKSPEWVEAFYKVGLTPTIDLCEAPDVDPIKKYVEAEAPAIKIEPVEVDMYNVNFFLGNQAISTTVPAESPEAACAVAAAQEAETLAPHVNESGMLAASAVNVNDSEDHWGPGVVRIPVEFAVGFSDMSPAQRENARGALGIQRHEVAPAFGIG